MADIAITLWGRDLLQQWKTQINILSVSVSNQEISQAPNKNLILIRLCYRPHLQTVQAVHKQDTAKDHNLALPQGITAAKTPTALPLRWLTDQPIQIAITWQQAKKIVKQCPTCLLYNQTPLPMGTNPKGTQTNDI